VKPIDWKNAHEQLVRLAGSRAALDHEEGRWLLAALRSAAHVRLGYATFAEYVERLFGYAPRWTAEKLRVAEAVEELPQMDQALRDGALNWSALRELTRVATRNTEGEWIEASKGRSARQIEQLVAGHRPGDRPDDPACPLTRKHVLRLELSADAMAAYKEAIAKLQRDAGGRLDEEEALLQMARQVLGGPTDQGRASYQIALTVCDRCGRGWQQGRGELMEVGPEVVEMAGCDAQRIGDPHVGPKPTRAEQDIPPAVRRQVMRRDQGRCHVPGCRSTLFLDLHHIRARSEGGPHDADNLIALCGAHHRAHHRGLLIIEGQLSTGMTFRHADGTRYGSVVAPQIAEARAEAFQALRSLGFAEPQARRALQAACAHVGNATADVLLREALAAAGR